MLNTLKQDIKNVWDFPALMLVIVLGTAKVDSLNDLILETTMGVFAIAFIVAITTAVPTMGPKLPLPSSTSFIGYSVGVVCALILAATANISGYFFAGYFNAQQVDWSMLIPLTIVRNVLLAPVLAYWGWNVHSKLVDLTNIELDPIRSP